MLSPTGIGGAVAGGVAIGAGIGSRLASLTAVVAHGVDGNWKAAGANAVGVIAGGTVATGLHSAQRTMRATSRTEDLSSNLIGDAVGNAVGEAGARSCQ